MKTILIIILLIPAIKSEKNINKPIVDYNLFKTEMQLSIDDFINDMDLNPDSCYMPFKSDI